MKESKRVLFVLTSHDKLGDTGEKTGFWIEEFAAPYYTLIDNGVSVSLASPKGGQPPIDPRSVKEDAQTNATRRFYQDNDAQMALAKTMELKTVSHEDYDAIFYPGGHGPLWDLANDLHSIALIESFNEHKKPIAAVCHAPAVFKHTKKINNKPLVDNAKVTGFTNTEEDAVELTFIVPFLVEDMLKENGAEYSKGDDWKPYAVEDGVLITGQNPASSELVANLLLKRL